MYIYLVLSRLGDVDRKLISMTIKRTVLKKCFSFLFTVNITSNLFIQHFNVFNFVHILTHFRVFLILSQSPAAVEKIKT